MWSAMALRGSMTSQPAGWSSHCSTVMVYSSFTCLSKCWCYMQICYRHLFGHGRRKHLHSDHYQCLWVTSLKVDSYSAQYSHMNSLCGQRALEQVACNNISTDALLAMGHSITANRQPFSGCWGCGSESNAHPVHPCTLLQSQRRWGQ